MPSTTTNPERTFQVQHPWIRSLQAKRDETGQAGYTVIAGLVAVFLVVGAIWLVMFMLGWKSVAPDKVMLHYTGGPIQGTHFVEVVPPGTHTKFYGLLDHYYYLPSTQRTYVISKDPNQGEVKGQADFLSAPSNDNVQFTFEAAVYFKLNVKPSVLREFMEQICFHDNCTDLSSGGGWDRMLAQYFRPQIDNAVRLEVEKYNREQLYRDPNVLLAIQKAVGSNLKERINAVLGGEFFCGPDSTKSNCTDFGFVLKNPTPPDEVVQAYADTAAATQQVVTAQQQAQATEAAAQGQATAQKIRASAPPVPQEGVDYIRAQAMQACAQNPNCKLTIVSGVPNAVISTGP